MMEWDQENQQLSQGTLMTGRMHDITPFLQNVSLMSKCHNVDNQQDCTEDHSIGNADFA